MTLYHFPFVTAQDQRDWSFFTVGVLAGHLYPFKGETVRAYRDVTENQLERAAKGRYPSKEQCIFSSTDGGQRIESSMRFHDERSLLVVIEGEIGRKRRGLCRILEGMGFEGI